MKAEIIKTSGERISVKPENGTDYFELHEMQEIVGGWIEIVRLRDGSIMVVNEEGKVNRLEPNIVATNLLLAQGGWDMVVGDVLVCDAGMVK